MLGDKIRQYRKTKQLSQEDLAEALGVSRQSISFWENNQTQPTIENIIALAKLFNISTDELLSTNASNDDESAFYPIESSPTPPQTNPVDSQRKGSYTSIKVILIIIPIILILTLAGVLLGKHFFIDKEKNNDIQSTSLTAEEIYDIISPSVVEIVATSSNMTSTGTGFFYDKNGTVITNFHVVEECQQAKIILSNGDSYEVTYVVGYDADRDIAVLSTNYTNSNPLPIRSAPAKTGETVYALGSSKGLTGTLSNGIISAADREIAGNTYIQTTAPVSHGNSGGPLVDVDGKVVGIICAGREDGQNLNFAIPITEIENISLTKSITLEKLFPKEEQEVEYLSNYRFQYYEDESAYVLLFQLTDQTGVPMSANGTVKIRIVNDRGTTVYNKTHTFSSASFEEWLYDGVSVHVAAIYIPPSSITASSTDEGTVYFEVFSSEFTFEECEIVAFDLPVKSTPSSGNSQGNTPTTPTTKPSTTIATTTTSLPEYTCWSTSCENAVNSYGTYCSEHRCATPGCSYEKDGNSNYCTPCSCQSLGCVNAKIRNGYYCIEHNCITAGCTHEKEPSSDYCQFCSCASKDCTNARIQNSLYCVEHTCIASGCTSQKDGDSDYCYYHTRYPD